MASVFGHSVVAYTAGKLLPKRIQSAKLFFLGIILSILPDADVIAFKFGIPYAHILGHRGFTHSISFSFLIALLVYLIFFRRESKKDNGATLRILYLFICAASHGLIDAMTSGGRGVALLFPISYERIFFDFRPILVSPLGASNFFSSWGLKVIWSESIWILLPCLIILGIATIIKRISA